MFYTYILQSLVTGRYYVGHAEDLNTRLMRHNSGLVRSTKSGKPWKIVYSEKFLTRSEAYRRELEIKSHKGGIKFKRLLGLWKD